MKKQSLFLISLFISAILVAQSPQRFSYQAVIRDAQSALVKNTTIGIRLSLLKGSLTGEAVYVETQSVLSNSNGLITAEVGAGTLVLGNFNTIDWAAGSYFIQSEFDPHGGTNYTLGTSSQLLSVPYALHANSADTALTAVTALSAGNGIENGTAVGEILYWNGTNWEKLQPGIEGQPLIMCNGKPSWGPCPEVVTLTVHEVTEIGSNAANVKVSIFKIPGLYLNSFMHYSKNPVPTEYDPTLYPYQVTDTSFMCFMDGLDMGTTYYVRAIANSSMGNVYSNIVSFTTSPSLLLMMGQNYAGGSIFYLEPGGQHGMTAKRDFFDGAPWGCEGLLIGSGAQHMEIGFGQTNTQAIVNSCSDNYTAAYMCSQLTSESYDDWFLPSVEELRLVFTNLIEKNIYGFWANEYWTSTEYDAGKAYSLNSSTGQNTSDKSNWIYYLPIRAF